jgi:adenine-specific DNA-methyltransferase
MSHQAVRPKSEYAAAPPPAARAVAGVPAGQVTPETLLDVVEMRRVLVSSRLDAARKADLGQFLTPAGVARIMASMLAARPEELRLLDAGAGIGTLTAACIAEIRNWETKPRSVHATAFEVDPVLAVDLRTTLEDCRTVGSQMGIDFAYSLRTTDFITECTRHLGDGGLFSYGAPRYNCAILNPPYRKIRSGSAVMDSLRRMDIPISNIYPAFVWLAVRLLEIGGEIVAITPRSFCNGPYFRRFRRDFLRTVSLRRIHIYESREQAFRDDEVLQENIVFHGVRGDQPPAQVTVTSSVGPDDEQLMTHSVSYERLVHPSDPDSFIRILPNGMADRIGDLMHAMSSTINDLGLIVSTGRVVDFRARELLKRHDDSDIVPLMYPCHLKSGFVEWPNPNCSKPDAIAAIAGECGLLLPVEPYVVVKRFSAKEEKRRIAAAVFDPARIPFRTVGFENHLNYFHAASGSMSIDIAKGLTLFLNSTLVDEYFRQFSGHTQVNASDLRSLKYPSADELCALGRRVVDGFPEQDELDQLVEEEVGRMSRTDKKSNPILAKRKISQALDVLRTLEMPRQQQNERSALTLLSLLDMKASTPWSRASSPMRGITEMMDYFAEHFGVKYAPNTRETVRRQTIHQFMQAGLVVANPDNPGRPVNSPDNRYQIDDAALALIRCYGGREWSAKAQEYLRTADTLRSLHASERARTLVPVRLPDGRTLKLSAGEHSHLLRDVVKEFCPRFTPGGFVVYIGDTGDKLKGDELPYLKKQGVFLDEHGKMPDVIIHHKAAGWLVLVEAVTSHGPMSIKRHNELKVMFRKSKAGLVFVTAFPTRAEMKKHLAEIAWETEVWVAEAPSHLIHFNGERFLGPY